MDYKEYIHAIDQLYHVGNTTEHSFRGALANYLQTLLPKFVVTNEPRRIDCGAPDYVITKDGVPVAFLEAKDVNDGDLDGRRNHKEQFNRYKASLDRIVFTDYLDFHLYVGGELKDTVRIAETRGDHVFGLPENELKFNEMIFHLATDGRQKITSSSSLARQMAAKAHLLADAVKKNLELDGEDGDGEMAAQLRAFRNVLIHDLKPDEFADIYAQTIVYGFFTARLNDSTPENFSRSEAVELVPKSNPFLRKIFHSVVFDIDDSISWIVDDLVAMFAVTDAEKIMKNYGSNGRHSDPIVHFYEDFLAEYDPKLRKARGVWYTPAPVVKFIVKSVDEILQKEFGLSRGLADDSTVKVSRAIEQSKDKRTSDGMKHEMVDVPRVQILDPATGTGTFLAEVIQQIRDKFDGLEGLWPSYVEKSLIPRIHGFEILMASYTIAHLKLALTLKNTGYTGQTNQRLNVFLTNSLEEATPRASTLFAKWLSDEADAASKIKNETPIMIALGNPPYSISSQNSGPWITNLLADYKKNLMERNIQPLSDDYIKFIRLGQFYIHKNGEGVLAYISNNGFLDGIIHRQMRKSLLEEFDKIYILNLHGNNRRKETAPDGALDENVFDIMQGVSINLFVKSEKGKRGLGRVFYHDVYGERPYKYDFLNVNSFDTVDWVQLNPVEPYYFFVPKDFSTHDSYEKGIKLDDLMPLNLSGVQSGRDAIFVDDSKVKLEERVKTLLEQQYDSVFAAQYKVEDSSGYPLLKRISESSYSPSSIVKYLYRPFDFKQLYYDEGLIKRAFNRVNQHMLKDNISLLTCKQQSTFPYQHALISKHITDMNSISMQSKEATYVFPLYLYAEDGTKHLNMDKKVLDNYSSVICEEIVPEELLQYIYAVLYSPKYRSCYREFLKIDFPRIPYPKDADQFHRLAEKGAELRRLHLMEDAQNWERRITFPVPGENNENPVEAIRFEDGKVWINKSQYFGNVPELAWTFFIGGYQPAQKWLKDRKGRNLDYQDILHYGHIIYALEETDRIMKEIDEIGVI